MTEYGIKALKTKVKHGDVLSTEEKNFIGKALKKQIPKEPKKDNRYVMFICPCCNDFVKVGHNYCQNCGQKLDFWRVINNEIYK